MSGSSTAGPTMQRARFPVIGSVASIALVLGLLPTGAALAEPPDRPDPPPPAGLTEAAGSPSDHEPPGQTDKEDTPDLAGTPGTPEPLAQVITFTPPASAAVGEAITLDAVASSSLPVGYRAQPRHRCTLEASAGGTLLRLEAEGTCTLSASQPGDEAYAPAPDVEVAIEVTATPAGEPPAEPTAKADQPQPPGQAEPPGHARSPGDVGPPVEPGPPSKADDQTQPPGQAKKLDRGAPPGQADDQDGPAKPAKPDRPDKPDGLDKPDHQDKPVSPGDPEPPGQVESHGQADKGVEKDQPGHKADVPVPTAEADIEVPATTGVEAPAEPSGQVDPPGQSAPPGQSGPRASVPEPVMQPMIEGAGALPILRVTGGYVYEGDSGVRAISFTASLSAASGVATTFFFSTADQSATAGSDYTTASGTMTILAGSTSLSFPVTVNGDTTVEPSESFVILVSNVTGATYDAPGSTPIGTIYDDDDLPTLTLRTNAVVEPGHGLSQEMTVRAQLSSATDVPVSFAYRTVDGTATSADGDYQAKIDTVVIPAGTFSGSFTVTVVDDEIVEPEESFALLVSDVVGARYNASGADAYGSIFDDDGVPTLSIRSHPGPEAYLASRGLIVDATLSQPSNIPVTFTYATADESASSPTDYVAKTGTITFPPRSAGAQFIIAVNDDAVFEPDERFVISVTGVVGATLNADWSDRYAAIYDDDRPPTLELRGGGAYEGDAGTRTLSFRASLSRPFTRNVTFTYATADESATAASDYVAATGTSTILAGSTETTFTVTVNGDATAEIDERFVVLISNVTFALYDGGNSSAYGFIWNDDGAPVLLIRGSNVDEGQSGSRWLAFQMGLSHPPLQPVTVTYWTIAETATAGSDYLPRTGTLTIPAGQRYAYLRVPVIGDAIAEPDERFAMAVSTGPGVVYDASASEPYGWIRDDDAPPLLRVYGSAAHEDANGSADLYFQATLSHASATPITFDFATIEGTATADDYVARSGHLTIPPGEGYASIRVLVSSDTIVEPDERLELLVSNLVGAAYDAAGDPYGDILDDDAIPRLSLEDSNALEGDAITTDLIIRVLLSRPSNADVTFTYVTTNQGATAGSDYIAEKGTVVIPVGCTSIDLPVSIEGDTMVEPDESFRLQITNVTGATYDAAVGPSGTIRNDDGPPTLSVQGTNVDEGDSGTAEDLIAALLSHPSASPVSFQYATANDSATAGSDYVSSSGRITIPVGQTIVTFPVRVMGDALVEPDERFRVNVLSITGATYPGAFNYPYGTIRNDDGPPWLYLYGASTTEGDRATRELTFELRLSHAPDGPVTFRVATAPDSATGGVDYVATSRLLTILAPETSTHFSITVNGDTTVEPDERFKVVVSDVVGASFLAIDPYGGILNDDSALSVSDVTVGEAVGSAVFTVSLTPPGSRWIRADYSAWDGSAIISADYTARAGIVVFAPGETSKTVAVPVISDALDEPDETFSLVLSSPVNATIADGTGIATIVDDDAPLPASAPTAAPTAPPAQPAPPADTMPPSVSAPTADLARGALGVGSTPVKLVVAFSASDPSGLASTALQHRTGAGAYAGIALASGTATSATIPVGTSAKTVHQFQARATDGAGNTSPFATGAAFRVKVVQDGASAIKAKGTWATKGTRSAFGGSVRQASKANASQTISLTASDLAIVSTMGPDRGKAKVVLDGKAVATLDLYSRTTRAKQVIYAVSFPSTGKHTIALVAVGSKNAKAKGTRVDLDAFLALTP